MSQRVQVVLSDPVATQLRELAAGADTPHSTLAAQFVGNEIARAIKNGHVRPLHSAPVLAEGNSGERARWLEPYGGDAEWRSRCGARSSRCTAATPNSSNPSKTNGGPRRPPSRHWARSPSGEQSSTNGRTPARRSRSKPSSPTTPKPSAKRAAASRRHGSRVRRQSGPRSGPRADCDILAVLCRLRVTRSQAERGYVRSAHN